PPYPSKCPQGDILWELLVRNFIPSGSVIFRRSCLAQIGLLDDRIPGLDDWDLWIRIAEMFPVLAMETPVTVWRQSTASSAQGSSDTVGLIERGRRRFREEWLRLPRVSSAAEEERRKAWRGFSKNIAEHLAWESFSAFHNGQPGRVFRISRTLLQLHPAALAHVLRRWTRGSTVVTLGRALAHREELPTARARLKQFRSNYLDHENPSL
ncbi:MAG TPA: hypothetical protein VKD91_12970, partial [Pyrinomonadaceae bacterium]|nr:hypothetical protein [Pyrinomonadaceae bacterium]